MNEKLEIINGKKVYDARKAMVVNDGKILLLKTNIPALQLGHNPELGTWDVPGGRMQINDTDEDTLIREIKEEAGIDAVVVRYLQSFEFYPREDVVIRAKSFLCRPLSTNVVMNDPEQQHNDFKWVTLDEALVFDIPKYVRDAILLLKKQ